MQITRPLPWAVNFAASTVDTRSPAAPRPPRACPASQVVDDPRSTLTEDRTRALLRKLRDLNVSAGPIAVSRRLQVALGGCLSLDGPAESGVRYRLRLANGSEGLLELRGGAFGLEIAVSGPPPLPRASRIRVDVACDDLGRVCAPALGARVSPESCDGRELEHFLRRVVRTLARRSNA